jgi:hypothetical protein
MPDYLYTATTRGGIATTARIEAASLAQARSELERQGLTAIVFHTDPAAGDTFKARDFGISAADELRSRRGGGFVSTLWMALRNNAPLLLVLAWWNLQSVRGPRPFDWWDWLGFGLTIAWWLYFLFRAIPGVLFRQMIEAGSWARWAQMQRLCALLRRTSGTLKKQPHLLDYYDAHAMIGLGQVDAGIAQFARWDQQVDPATFVGLLGSLQQAARRFDDALVSSRRLTLVNPDNAMPWADLGTLLARLGHGDAASDALRQARQRELTSLVEMFVVYAEAIVLLDSGEFAKAATGFSQTLERVSSTGNASMMKLLAANMQGYLAVAAMRLGAAHAEREALR